MLFVDDMENVVRGEERTTSKVFYNDYNDSSVVKIS